MLALDSTTRAEYDAATTAAQRGAAVLSAITDPVTATVRDGSGVARGSGTMQAPWATISGARLVIGELASFSVTNGGTPTADWYLEFSGNGRTLRGSFGLSGSGADFTWSLPTFTTGQAGALGTVQVQPQALEPVLQDEPSQWNVLTFTTKDLSPSWAIASPVQPLAFGGVPATVTLNQSGSYVALPTYVSGGTTPYTYSATGLPAGVSINASTGALTGAGTTAAGTYSGVTVTVTDALGATASATFTLSVISRYRVITDAMLANANAHKTANSEQYSRALGQANAALTVITESNTAIGATGTLALMYRLTGNTAYRDRVNVIFDYITAVPASTFTEGPSTTDQRDLKRDSAFDVPAKLVPVAYALDLLYEELSLARRQAISTWIMDWTDFLVYDASSPAMLAVRASWQTSVYGRQPYSTYRGMASNNYWWKYASSMIGVIVAVDDTGTGSSGYAGSRRDWHLADFAQRWTDQVLWRTDRDDDFSLGNGLFKESSSYDSTGTMLPIVFAFKESGINTDYIQNQFVQEIPNARTQIFMPDDTHRANYGDQAGDSKDQRNNADRQKSQLAAAIPGGTVAERSRLYRWLLTYPTTQNTARSAIVQELCYYDLTHPVAANNAGADLQHVSPGGIISISRNSWTDPNTSVIVYTGGAPYENHMYRAGGAIVWWKGTNYILANANMYSYTGIVSGSFWHNVPVLIGPDNLYIGQGYPDPNSAFAYKHWHDVIGGDYAGASVDYNDGYKSAVNTPSGYQPGYTRNDGYLSQYTRKWLYVSALDALLVLDRVQMNPTIVTPFERWYRWWGGLTLPTVSGSDFEMVSKSTTHKLYGRVVSGELVETSTHVIQLRSTGKNGDVHCIQVKKSGMDVDRVLMVMQAASIDATSPPRAISALITSISGSAYRGCAIGSTVVMFADADSTYTATTYETNATTHYVTDCVPNRAYTIAQQPSGGGGVETTYSATASPQGVLKFQTTNNGTTRFVLS